MFLSYQLLVEFILCTVTTADTDILPERQGLTTFFDRFGDEVTLIYSGGYGLWRCAKGPSGKRKCNGTEKIALINPLGEVVDSKICQAEKYWVHVRLNFTDNTTLGGYRCMFNGKREKEPEKIDYMVCDDRMDTCRKSNPCKEVNSFCVITKQVKVKTCSKIPSETVCEVHQPDLGLRICPLNVVSFCHALLGDRYDKALIHLGRDSCAGPAEDLPRLLYLNTTRLYTESYMIDSRHPEFRIEIPGIQSHFEDDELTCIIKDQAGIEYLNYSSVTSKLAVVKLDKKLFSGGYKVFKLHCILLNPGSNPSQAARIAAIMVYLDKNDKKVSLRTKSEPGILICQLEPSPSPADFIVEYWWIQISLNKKLMGSKIQVPHTDEYRCHVKVTYRSCTPFREFSLEKNSTSIPAVTITTTSTASVVKSKSFTKFFLSFSIFSCYWSATF